MSTLFHLFLQVRNISLGQDGLSPNQGVFVEEVEVTAPRGSPVVFPCRCWLAEDEDDGQTTRVLVPGESLTSRYDSKSFSILNWCCDVVWYQRGNFRWHHLFETFRSRAEIFPILSGARVWTSVILAGKRDSQRHSTASFSDVFVTGASSQMLAVLSFSDRERE